jgi:hypothetical protein
MSDGGDLILRILRPVLALMVTVLLAAPTLALTPKEFGTRDLMKAVAATQGVPPKMMFRVGVPGDYQTAAFKAALKVLPVKAESFAVARSGSEIAIVGRDEVGAMYGCFELAERLDMQGRLALDIRRPIVQSPAVSFRAVNPFLTLPYKEDGSNWYFLQEDYWEGYLDQLARARINWVDLHGMYDLKSTGFPNLYCYFITSDQFPDVGVEPEVAKRNLAMLNKVISMAKARGIKFGIMSYAAKWDGEGLRKPTSERTGDNLAAYTREVVRKMIEQCPDLAMIGFRIGETGMKETFFKDSYIPAIKEAGRTIDLYTRTWLARKPPIVDIGREFPGRFFVEIKYNGEQFGPPYIIAGGRTVKWHSYFFQDYYSYPQSYKIIYQLRANGTHRVFPWGEPELAARANVESTLGGVLGLCVEPIDAYYPKHDSRHKDDSPNRWYKWQYQRDWLWYHVWGRTAYDPALGKRDDLWIRMFAKRFGKEAAPHIYQAMKWASKIVPDAYTAYCFGPDHRNHAIELEWGDNVKAFSKGQPFDTQNIIPTREFAQRLVNGDPDGRTTPLAMASYLAEESAKTMQALESARQAMPDTTPEFNDLSTELRMLAYLGSYYAHKLTAGALYAVMVESSDLSLESRIRTELDAAHAAWRNLAKIGDEHYKPFLDTLRMRTEEYTWSKEAERLPTDLKVLDETIAEVKASGKTGRAPAIPLPAAKCSAKIAKVDSVLLPTTATALQRLKVAVTFKDPAKCGKVSLKWKPMPSETDWTLTPMAASNGVYSAQVDVTPDGLLWCVEVVDTAGTGTIWPDFRVETPYRVVLPWDAGAE